MPRFRYVPILITLLCLALGSCHQPQDTSGGRTPEVSLHTTMTALKSDNLGALLRQALPSQDYANLRADWPRLQQQWLTIPAAKRAAWQQNLHQLTAVDARQQLAARLLPRQAAMEQKYQDQWPIFVAIGAAWLKKDMNQSGSASADQTTRINRLIDALTPWAQQAAWFDPVRARQAINVTVTTARQVGLSEPDAWRTMDFDAALSRAGIALAGTGKLVSIYGLSLDAVLGSAKLTQIDLHDNQATVRMSLNVQGQPVSVDMPMVKQDGRWYSMDLLEAARWAHALALQGAPTSATKD